VSLLARVIALGLVVFVVSALYLTGPKTMCAYDIQERPGVGGGPLCLKHERTNVWERISGAVE
jgi:hypothetical protein